MKNGESVETTADLIIGADGAYSALRKLFMKMPRFNYAQVFFNNFLLYPLNITSTNLIQLINNWNS